MRILLLPIVVFSILPAVACAQAPAAKPVKAAANKPAVAASPAPKATTAVATGSTQSGTTVPVSAVTAPEAPFTYQPDGRRDPFLTLVEPAGPAKGPVKVEARKSVKKGEGLAGLSVNEIVLRGVMSSDERSVALVQGADRHTYFVRSGDKVMDGTVKSIDSEGLVIVQDVTDPLAKIKHREIRKLLRPLEEKQ